MKKLIIVLALFSLKHVNAQNYIDLVKVDYALSSSSSYDSSNAKVNLKEMNGDITLPVVINENTAFLTGISYEMTQGSFNPYRENESVTGITLKLGTNIKHSEKWGGTYMLLPKISSDWKKIGKNDLQLGGVALLKYSKSDHINYKFGLYANTELFSTFLVPILGFYYLSPNDKFEAKVLLPLAVDLNYAVTEKAKFGFNFKGQVRTYNLNEPLFSENDRYLARSTNDLYAYFQYGLDNGINFQLAGGRSVARSYRIYNETVDFAMPLVYFGSKRSQLNRDFSDSWLLKFSVFYRLKL
ncbi:hypothetical protein DNU06_09500 [Putridiphycobacter roseus]|uniref:DUF6268 domain-containing protein n=1 Tax=Putridiphycobacter roseus TaxID=2219161 RepID=A0A2W1NG14_9FLAO|nr:DUF6268 family outer membrane beta-barrel protein [Putridiphycobacter roseus]PZE16976.1 hypothetical protein DNU06_09500 [Putridiphycobacter roseus]